MSKYLDVSMKIMEVYTYQEKAALPNLRLVSRRESDDEIMDVRCFCGLNDHSLLKIRTIVLMGSSNETVSYILVYSRSKEYRLPFD